MKKSVYAQACIGSLVTCLPFLMQSHALAEELPPSHLGQAVGNSVAAVDFCIDGRGSLSAGSSAKAEHRNSGFIDFNFYPYTLANADNAVTVNTLVNLPHNLQYFGFVNLERQPDKPALTETSILFSEQNLRWQPWEAPVSLATQVQIKTGGSNNDVLHFGPRFAVHDLQWFRSTFEKCNLRYWIAIYGAQFDRKAGYQWQMEHAFRCNVLPEIFDDRVYIGGFADHLIDHEGGSSATWVEEAQLGVRVVGEWYVVAEQRYNGFRRGREASLGVGLEYVMRFK